MMKLKTYLRRYVIACSVAIAAGADMVPGQVALNLFNGTSTNGWNAHGTWVVTGGALTSNTNGDRNLLTAVPFGDFSLQFEYSESAPVGAILRLWATRENTGGLTVALDTSNAKDGVGSIADLSHSSLKTVSAGWHRVQVEASHGQVSVRIDGQPAGTASGLGARAGYLGFQATMTGQLQVRGVRLMPLNTASLFNGTDLGGWKSIARGPEAKGGVGHSAAKVLTFGMGGGSDKPHEAKWTVRGGSIHGESGPGALENSTMLEDGVLQLTATYHGDAKPEQFTAIDIRNTAGQIAGGYSVGIGSFAGSVQGLSKGSISRVNTPVDETVVIGGRTIAVWVGGNLVSVSNDSRPESGNAGQGARTQAGVLSLVLPGGNAQVDVSHLGATAFQKPYGLLARATLPPPTPPVSTAANTTAATIPAGSSAAETALLKQQQETAQKDATEQANKQHVAALMSQALVSTDPQQQQNLYGQVIQLDPANPNAMQGYKEAQSKLQQQQSAAAQNVSKQQDAQSRDQQTDAALVTAQGAFLSGHLSEASNALSIAERLSPNNPLVRELRTRIGNAQSLRSRLFFIGGGIGLVALLSAMALWLRRRKQQKNPALEITSGLDSGKIYSLEKDQTRIGAVPQDGGQKNDIVVRDVEHAISRFHCEIIRRNGQLYLQDLNSSNGTRLNGERLKPGSPELLRKGSRIKLAETVEMRFGYARNQKKG